MCVNSWPIAKSFFSWLTQMEGWAGLHMTGFTSSGQWVSHSRGQRLIPPLCLLEFYWDRSFHCTSYRVLVPCSASHEQKTTVAWGLQGHEGTFTTVKIPETTILSRGRLLQCVSMWDTQPLTGRCRWKAMGKERHTPLWRHPCKSYLTSCTGSRSFSH